jgi:hypothetical protein
VTEQKRLEFLTSKVGSDQNLREPRKRGKKPKVDNSLNQAQDDEGSNQAQDDDDGNQAQDSGGAKRTIGYSSVRNYVSTINKLWETQHANNVSGIIAYARDLLRYFDRQILTLNHEAPLFLGICQIFMKQRPRLRGKITRINRKTHLSTDSCQKLI